MATTELDTITIEGFRSIASIKALKLRPINVLIGPNGSGKSNFIGVFSLLHALRSGQLQDYVGRSGGASALLHFGTKRTQRIHLGLSFQGGVNGYEVVLNSAANDEFIPGLESVSFWKKARHPDGGMTLGLTRSGKEAGISTDKQNISLYVRKHLSSWRVYHAHDTSNSSPMKAASDLHDNQYLRENASNLAAFLYMLRERHADAYSLIRGVVQRVAPFFEDFALAPSNLNRERILLEWKHVGSDAYFGPSSMSDGTLRFIALATLFLQPKQLRPSVILVDEPELGLHPYAIEMLASLIRSASEQTQVIVSTQSPLLLDHFEPEDVLVADRVNGGTQLTRLENSPYQIFRERYSLGQLWEKNEIGGRPATEAVR